MQVSLRVRRVGCRDLGPRTFQSPLRHSIRDLRGAYRFVRESDWILDDGLIKFDALDEEELLFEKAGPRARLFFDPQRTTAAMVTCGGICPGLNDVIRSLFLELWHNYGVRNVLGVRNGYLGLSASGDTPITLTPEFVEDIHLGGGTVLGTSRGERSPAEMVDFLVKHKVNMLFCVGGDGTQRGAHAIADEIVRRDLPISIVGIPKTIDNDIAYCDRTFGMVTAIEETRKVIVNAHTEAKAAVRGIGLVKVMGRHAGFIACGAALASQEANFVLIPEVPFDLAGPHGFLAAIRARMTERDHAVIIVAEGAGQNLFAGVCDAHDVSGNLKHKGDIGPLLKQCILEHFADHPVDVKYIDPSYMVRSVPANSDDRMLCDALARHAVHAAMSGKTDLIVSYKNGKYIHVPIDMVTSAKQCVDTGGELWAAVLAATGQPKSFTNTRGSEKGSQP